MVCRMGTRSIIACGLVVGTWLGPGVRPAQAQQLRVENAFPRQLPPGQATVVNIVVATRDDVLGAEVSPSQGVTVSAIARGETFQSALTWFEITLDVAKDATPGDRALVVQLPAGRTTPTPLTIPSHVPRIADLRVVRAPSTPPALDVEVTASDPAADLGPAPHVWFMVACGDMPLPGVVRATVTTGAGGALVRARVPRPALRSGTTSAPCEVRVRVSDAGGNESNTLRTTLDVAG